MRQCVLYSLSTSQVPQLPDASGLGNMTWCFVPFVLLILQHFHSLGCLNFTTFAWAADVGLIQNHSLGRIQRYECLSPITKLENTRKSLFNVQNIRWTTNITYAGGKIRPKLRMSTTEYRIGAVLDTFNILIQAWKKVRRH